MSRRSSDYQLNEAWTWEHMAMSRGRPIAGDAELMARVSASARSRSSTKPRDRKALAADVASMRARIEREKAAAGPFDVKLARGGLIDCEFAAQFLVLSGLGRVAGETTLETLQRASETGSMATADGRAAGPLRCAAERAAADRCASRIRRAFDRRRRREALKELMVEAADDVAQGTRRR